MARSFWRAIAISYSRSPSRFLGQVESMNSSYTVRSHDVFHHVMAGERRHHGMLGAAVLCHWQGGVGEASRFALLGRSEDASPTSLSRRPIFNASLQTATTSPLYARRCTSLPIRYTLPGNRPSEPVIRVEVSLQTRSRDCSQTCLLPCRKS